MEDWETRLRRAGIELPEPGRPVGAYVPALEAGGLVYTSGQLPWVAGRLAWTGRVGEQLSLEEGREAARACVLNALGVVRQALGGLGRVSRAVRVVGYVQAAPAFHDHAQVVNGASELLLEVFGEQGAHVRSAVGVASLPLDAPVELELVLALGGPVR